MAGYTGRFAPSPTGLLHAGSLVAALASWLDARAHGGQWLIRIEDIDTTRCIHGVDEAIIGQLAQCGLNSDAPVVWQSERSARYRAALDELIASRLAYPCSCSRQSIERALGERPHLRGASAVYPQTCRLGPTQTAKPLAWRLRTDLDPFLMANRHFVAGFIEVIATEIIVDWSDRRLGPQRQNVSQAVGDFVLKRADGQWAYQLAVVVDDAAQGITHVVRGQDLADNTARQVLLQHALGLSTPRYLHTDLVLGEDGEKLSKQNRATPIDTASPAAALSCLSQAAKTLGLIAPPAADIAASLSAWVKEWQATQ